MNPRKSALFIPFRFSKNFSPFLINKMSVPYIYTTVHTYNRTYAQKFPRKMAFQRHKMHKDILYCIRFFIFLVIVIPCSISWKLYCFSSKVCTIFKCLFCVHVGLFAICFAFLVLNLTYSTRSQTVSWLHYLCVYSCILQHNSDIVQGNWNLYLNDRKDCFHVCFLHDVIFFASWSTYFD